MASITQLYRLSNLVLGGSRTVLHRKDFIPAPVPKIQACYYTRKSAEERLGIEKPKRPLTPFFKFMTQMRPALLAKNPGITSKDAISWSSKHWQQLDVETKKQMVKEYEKDMEDYKKIKELYEASLTDQQKEDIQKVKGEMQAAKDKRKLRAEYKELGRPKKPMSSYFLYIKSRKINFEGKQIKEFQEKLKQDWQKLPENEKAKFEKEAQDLMAQYFKDLQAWELKMISKGRSDLVRAKPLREKKDKTKTAKKAQ